MKNELVSMDSMRLKRIPCGFGPIYRRYVFRILEWGMQHYQRSGGGCKMTTSDGSTADYYELPAGATQLQDLISHRDMNAQLGEIFRAAYRYGIASHSGKLRDAKKIRFYIEAEIKRLEALINDDGCLSHNPKPIEPASLMQDDSPRMQAIGQNGNDGEHYAPSGKCTCCKGFCLGA